MATSKHHKNHKQKVNQFKNKVMTAQKQNAIEKTHLIPQPEWQSTDNLDARGDLLQIIDQSLVAAYSAIARAGQAYQQIIANNFANGKAKLTYTWNTGEPATEEEVANYESQMNRIRELQEKQRAEARAAEAAGVEQKEQLPGAALTLTDAWGNPISSEDKKAEAAANEAASFVDEGELPE